METKKDILKIADNLEREYRRFNKAKEKFKNKFNSVYIHGDFSQKIDGILLYKNNEFYKPKRVLLKKEKKGYKIIIETNSWGLFSWSSIKEIQIKSLGDYKEFTKDFLNEYIDTQMKKYINGFDKLKEEVLKELKKEVRNSSHA